jgi:hypothetical protein
MGNKESTSASEQKLPIEEVTSNLKARFTVYVDINPPKNPSHKHEPSVDSFTLEESVAFGGLLKFWKNPLYIMVKDGVLGYLDS